MASKTISKEQEYYYWNKWKENNDHSAINILIEKYIPLVEFVVQRFAVSLPQNVHKDDILSFAYNGLLDAINKFDIERGLQFETYASWRIRGAIIDGLRQADWLPRSAREKAKKIEEAYAVLEQQYLRAVTDKEVSEYLGITEEELNQTILDTSLATLTSIHDPIYDEDNQKTERGHLITNGKANSPEDALHKEYLKELLTTAIERLPEKEKHVVALFYFHELNLTEIADVMKLSTSRISQIHSKAVIRLKSFLAKEREFIELT